MLMSGYGVNQEVRVAVEALQTSILRSALLVTDSDSLFPPWHSGTGLFVVFTLRFFLIYFIVFSPFESYWMHVTFGESVFAFQEC